MNCLRIAGGLFLSLAILAPVALQADDHDDHHREKRYYDRKGHDYHAWNDHEDKAYRVYLNEQHREYRDFDRAGRARQDDYFRWRHDHPDSVIFKVEVR